METNMDLPVVPGVHANDVRRWINCVMDFARDYLLQGFSPEKSLEMGIAKYTALSTAMLKGGEDYITGKDTKEAKLFKEMMTKAGNEVWEHLNEQRQARGSEPFDGQHSDGVE